MSQISQYAVAALFIEAVVFFFYFQKRSLPTFQNIVFLVILTIVTLGTGTELGAAYMEDNASISSEKTIYLLDCLYFTFNTTFGLLFSIYNISAFDVYTKLKKKHIAILQASLFVPCVLCLILVWLTPVLKNYTTLLFTIDLVEGYQRGNNFWFYGLCATKAFYVLLSFIVILFYHRYISKSKMQIMYFFWNTAR